LNKPDTDMKKMILPLCLLIASVAFAQTQDGKASVTGAPAKEGKVVFERVMQVRRPQNMDPEMAARIPASRTDQFELLFGADQSLWRSLPKADGDNNTFSAPGVVIRMAGNDDITYYNFATGRRLDKREMFDKSFLVEDSIAKLGWKLTGEAKSILGHPVQKAVTQRIGTRMSMSMENGEMKRMPVADTSVIVAWFTTDFPVQAGPQDMQGQLPGLILELDINNGRTVYTAVEISPKVSLSSIKEPKGGKKLSPAEFDKQRESMMEEMRKNMPAGNNVRVFSN
jgi:GLPGLI family protein